MEVGLIFVCLLPLLYGDSVHKRTVRYSAEEMIDLINKSNSTWKAGRHFVKDYSAKQYKRLISTAPGLASDMSKFREQTWNTNMQDLYAPESFDSRKKWPYCESIGQIHDQGDCSGWAVTIASIVTDRFCIHSNGTRKPNISAHNLLSCCARCGLGCAGGLSIQAWEHIMIAGIVTGGPYGSNEGCQPYQFKPCQHFTSGRHMKCIQKSTVKTPQCEMKCREGYNRTYKEDIYRIYPPTYTSSKTSEATSLKAKLEIMNNGPIQIEMTVMPDFLHYQSGIYQSVVKGQSWGTLPIKIIGWGVENNVKYWVCANTWNADWGEKGFFRLIDSNESDFTDFLTISPMLD